MAGKKAKAAEELDVLIIGAGLSGIGCAYYLQRDHADKSFAILEARASTGGTWDLFRYPGVRSDSDLHTFGFEFKPWLSDEAIAEGPEILRYIREASSENRIDERIRLHRRVLSANWSSEEHRWLAEVEHTDTGLRSKLRVKWIFAATGYFRYDGGYTPELPNAGAFKGRIVHPQQWPQELELAGKRVVVIGSGATAVTLVPAIAPQAAHVTMLQRSPTYVVPLPVKDGLANLLRRVLGARRGYALARRKNILQQALVYKLCQRFPRQARAAIRRLVVKQLPEGYPVDEHFKPTYNPWDQRLCIVPNGDLFRAISDGSASIVTDTITRFTKRGLELGSGRKLRADVVVTATGLRLLAFGGVEFKLDGERVQPADTVAFKGMMLSGMPNYAFLAGYTNASWTLKVGLVCEHFCRLLSHMDAHGYESCVPEPPDPQMTTRPLMDFSAGYVLRSLGDLPKQGTEAPWQMPMSFKRDSRSLRKQPVADPNLRFSKLAAAVGARGGD